MAVIRTTLYYEDAQLKNDTHNDDDFYGRALTKDEYENITADELRDAINHSIFMEEIGIGDVDSKDLRPTPEAERTAKAMSVQQLKEAIQQHNAVLMRSREPLHRYVFAVVTKGPRKGQTNWKKDPKVYMDRWYCVDFLNAEYGVVAVEGKVCLHDDGTFSVLEKAAA